MYSICYIVLSVTEDEDEGDSNVAIDNNNILIDHIYSLSQLNEKQLDTLIEETINKVIHIIETNPNTRLLSTAYATFEKYNFSEELEQLKNLRENAYASSGKTSNEISVIIDKTWAKTATGKIKHALLGTVIAQYNMKITWVVEDAKITSYIKDPSASTDSTYYTFKSSTIISEEIPPFYLGQRGTVKCKGTFQKLITWNPYDYIILEIWFYNDGGFDYVDTYD